jgi:hypothetical protein
MEPASLARPTGSGPWWGEAPERPRNHNKGQQCVDAVERYEADRSAAPEVCNVIAPNRGTAGITARHAFRRT